MRKRVIVGVLILTMVISNSQIVYAAEPGTVETESKLEEKNTEEQKADSEVEMETQPEEQEIPGTSEEGNSAQVDEQVTEQVEEEQSANIQEEENNSVQSAETNIFAENLQIDNFVWDLYKADLYLRPESVANKNIAFALTAKMPAEIVTDHLNHNAIFQNAVGAWKAVHMAADPSQISKSMLDEKGYYEAIIFSVFIGQQDNKEYISDICTSVSTETNQIISSIEKWVKESDNIDLADDIKNIKFGSLPSDKQKSLKDYLEINFIYKHPFLDKTGMLADMANTFLTASNNLGEAVENLSSYIKLSELSDDMKATLQEMYRQCPDTNSILKQALSEASTAMSSTEMALSTAIFNTAEKGTAEVAGAALKDFWKKAVNSCPYAKAFMVGAEIGTCIGTSISNTLFSTDKTIEQYVKMKCLGELVTVLRSSITSLGNTYLGDKTIANAQNYFASVDAMYTAHQISCNFAQEYADILYKDASLGWVGISEADYNGYSKAVASIKQDFNEMEKSLGESIKIELEGEYPEIYAILFGDNFNPIHVTGIAFEQDELTWGTKDMLLYLEAPKIYPEDSYNQRIRYTSSDPSVLEIGEYIGSCTAYKPGTVTVTAESEDGGYMDSITIHVVEGYGESGESIGVSPVVDSGECGKGSDNVYWTLYADGLLKIYGMGEMRSWIGKWTEYAPWRIKGHEIKYVIIDVGVTSIGSEAFRGCNNLTQIKIPKEVISIGDNAFAGCSSLVEVKVPEGVSGIGHETFRGCSNLKEIELPEGVTSIGSGAFEECSSLTEIRLPEGVTSIEDSTFIGCSSLREIKLPEGVTSIGFYVFSRCSSLTEIIIPERVRRIGNYVFRGCSSLREIKLPEGVTSIGRNAFEECSSMAEIKLPEGVTSIGEYAFYRCSSLREIKVPKGVSSIEDSVFSGCSGLKEIKLTGGVTSIGCDAFFGCSSLAEIKFPEGVTWIDESAFWGCSSLTEIKLPKGVRKIAEGVFGNCSSLREIKLPPEGVRGIIERYAFLGCSSLREIRLPEGVSVIEDSVFSGCSGLREIKLPEGVRSVGSQTFRGCSSLAEINLPKKVTSIGWRSFDGCSNLGRIIMQGNAPKSGSGIFAGCPNNMVIYVPKEATGYDTAPWTNYKVVYGNDNPDTPIHLPQSQINTIIKEIDSANAGSQVKAQMENATILPKEILQTMQGKDINVSFVMENNTIWEVNGKDVKKDGLEDAKLFVDINTKKDGKIPVQTFAPIVGELPANQLRFIHEGNFGFDAKLTLAVDNSFNTKKGVLLGYDGEAFNLVNSCIIKDGKATLKINKAQDCILVYVLNGDVDKDNDITIRDLMRILHHISSYQSMNILQQGAADVDFNNNVNIQDLMRELHFISGKSNGL